MFIGFRHSWAYLFNDDPGRSLHSYIQCYQVEIQQTEVVKLVASILPILGLFQVFDGWNAVTAGILRAKGKQVCTYILEISSRTQKKHYLQFLGALLNLR